MGISSMNTSNSTVKKKQVSEMIETLSNTSSISHLHAEKFLAQRDKIAMNRSRSNLKNRSENRSRSNSRSSSRTRPISAETAKAAEKLASERVEAMMSAMSKASLD